MSKLKLLEKMHKINQKDLAKVLGTNRVQISKYKTGKRKLDEDEQTKHAARISRGVFICAIQEWPANKRRSLPNVEKNSQEEVQTNRGSSHTRQPLTL